MSWKLGCRLFGFERDRDFSEVNLPVVEAADLFARGGPAPEVARRFRVSRMSANRRYRAWQAGGIEAPASKGPGGDKCRLDETLLARLTAGAARPRKATPRIGAGPWPGSRT